MSNFESAMRRKLDTITQEIKALEARRSQPGLSEQELSVLSAKLKAASEEHVAYMLDALPYVKEYYSSEHGAGSSVVPTLNSTGASGGQCTWKLGDAQVQRRGSIYKEYMCQVERRQEFMEPLPASKPYMTCSDCAEAPVLVSDRESMVCPACARCYPNSNLSFNNLSFEQQTTEVVQIACYRRSNHFSEWLSKLQAREVTKIPDDVMTAIKVELKKQRLADTTKITQAKIKELLKKLKLSKFYEHVPSIHSAITGVAAPKFPPALEVKLKQLFDEIQEPFEKHKGSKRSNMLSYGYVLYQLCRLLGETRYLPYLPLLKSAAKLWDCDQVWKRICADRQWEFVPTV